MNTQHWTITGSARLELALASVCWKWQLLYRSVRNHCLFSVSGSLSDITAPITSRIIVDLKKGHPKSLYPRPSFEEVESVSQQGAGTSCLWLWLKLSESSRRPLHRSPSRYPPWSTTLGVPLVLLPTLCHPISISVCPVVLVSSCGWKRSRTDQPIPGYVATCVSPRARWSRKGLVVRKHHGAPWVTCSGSRGPGLQCPMRHSQAAWNWACPQLPLVMFAGQIQAQIVPVEWLATQS